MTVQGQFKEMLKAVSVALGDELRARLVFVGGCTTALYIFLQAPVRYIRTHCRGKARERRQDEWSQPFWNGIESLTGQVRS